MLDSNKPRILVALGGRSSEREVSINSGREVAMALEKLGYSTDLIDIGTGKFHQIPELDKLEKDASKLPLVPNLPLSDIKRHFSLVFIAMHGKFGEDGGLQALLDEIGVKYVGSTPSACAVAQDKRFAKLIMKAIGIPTSEFQIIEAESDPLTIKFPVFIKPTSEGSSVGAAICENKADYDFALKNILSKYEFALVEPYLGKNEFSVAVLDGEKQEAKPLPVIQIIPKSSFFDLKSKYDGTTEEIIPAKIDQKLAKLLQDVAVKAHTALGMRHFSRTDIIVDQKGHPQVLDTNPIPGLTSQSLLPKAAKAAGFSFEDLVEHLVQLALK